jgi:hypothetical protein
VAVAGDEKATVDQMGGSYAVVHIEDGGETVDQRLVTTDDIPESADEGATLQETENGYEHDRSATENRRDDMSNLFDSLSERL